MGNTTKTPRGIDKIDDPNEILEESRVKISENFVKISNDLDEASSTLAEALKKNRQNIAAVIENINQTLSNTTTDLSSKMAALEASVTQQLEAAKTNLDKALADSKTNLSQTMEKALRNDRRNAQKVWNGELETNTVDLSLADNFNVRLKNPAALSFVNGVPGQTGVLVITDANKITGYAPNVKWRTVPSQLNTMETFAYFYWNDEYISIGRA
jgi:ABC-type transporter Mla subunit MlaD